MHSMHIDLVPGRDCMISEIFGNLREFKTLSAKETYLVLVKVRLSRYTAPLSNAADIIATDELIADLESDLSNISTPYLTVRITYKHTGFLDQLSTSLETGMSAHSTRLQSEATAVIQRTNLQSLWSPRSLRYMNGSANINPLIKLIETHFSTDKARDALRRLANERVRIAPAKRFDNAREQLSFSVATVKPYDESRLATRINSAVSAQITLTSTGLDGATETQEKETQNHEEDKDPARKIWTEIRRMSRGSHQRSDSSNTFRTEDPNCSLENISINASIDDERTRIKATAVKNKRSLGEDSLRSIAPSFESTVTEIKSRGSISIGLSMNNRWRWGGAWW